MPRLTAALVILVACQVLHLVEEIATGFRRRYPLGEMPWPVFIGINVALYSYAAATMGLSFSAHPASIPMAWLFAAVLLLNALGHLGIMLYRKAYFPGGGTALPLLAAVANVMVMLAAG